MEFDDIRLVYSPPRLSRGLAVSIIRLETLTGKKVGHLESR